MILNMIMLVPKAVLIMMPTVFIEVFELLGLANIASVGF